MKVYFEVDAGVSSAFNKDSDEGYALGQRFKFSADAVVTKQETELLQVTTPGSVKAEPVVGVKEVTIRLLNPVLTLEEE